MFDSLYSLIILIGTQVLVMALVFWSPVKWLLKKSWGISLAVSLIIQVFISIPGFAIGAAEGKVHLRPDATRVENVAAETANPDAAIYFIGRNRKHIYKMRLGDFQNTVLIHKSEFPVYSLQFKANKNNRCDLYASGFPNETLIVKDVSEYSPIEKNKDVLYPGLHALKLFSVGSSPKDSEWMYAGLDMVHLPTNTTQGLKIAGPFLYLPLKTLFELPNDEILFVAGSNIYLYWPKTKKLGVVAAGYCPVAVMVGYFPYQQNPYR